MGHRVGAIALSLLLTVLLGSGLFRLTADFSNDSFLRAGDQTLEVYDAFRARYGDSERMLVGIETPQVFDLEFLERLRAFHAEVEDRVPYAAEVLSLVNARSTRGEGDELIVDELMEDWGGTAADLALFEARVRGNPLYRNTFLSGDGAFTALTVKLDTYTSIGAETSDESFDVDAGFEDDETLLYLTSGEISETIDALRRVIEGHEGPGFRLYLVGGEVMGNRLETIALSDSVLFAVLGVASIAAFLWVLFRRVSAALLPVTVVLLSTVATFGCMGHLGLPFTSITQILPIFLLAVGVCDAVHILSIAYLRRAAGDDRETAIVAALEHSGLAVVLTSLTTAGGLASLMAAEISPVAQLGMIAPLGVVLALVYSLLLLPALLAVAPMPAPRGNAQGVAGPVTAALVRMADLSTRRPRAVLAATGFVLLLAIPGILQLRFGNHPLEWLFEDDPVRLAIERIDRAFEGTTAVEILIDSGVENGLHDPDLLGRIERAMAFATALREGPVSVGKAVSIVDIVKEINQALHENQAAHFALPDERSLIAQELLLFENSGSDDLGDVTDSLFREGRVTLQASQADGMHYVVFLETLEAGFREILGEDIDVQITGGMALVSRTFSLLLTSLVRSYALALLIITPLMVLLIGDLRRGLLSMIPNLIPVYLTLALMGGLGIPMSIGTLLIGSIVIGVAVDDTIHFMHKFIRYSEETGDPREAVRRTFATTGTALLTTSLVLATSFVIYVTAHFHSLIHFGILAGFATIVAFLADVLTAPALMVLAGPRFPGATHSANKETRARVA